MSEIPTHIFDTTLYEFQLGNNASATSSNISAALGQGTVADSTCRHWFKRFQEELIYHWEDYRRSPMWAGALIEDNPRLTIRDLSIVLGCSSSLSLIISCINWQKSINSNDGFHANWCNRRSLSATLCCWNAIDRGFSSKSLQVAALC